MRPTWSIPIRERCKILQQQHSRGERPCALEGGSQSACSYLVSLAIELMAAVWDDMQAESGRRCMRCCALAASAGPMHQQRKPKTRFCPPLSCQKSCHLGC